jgi:transposase
MLVCPTELEHILYLGYTYLEATMSKHYTKSYPEEYRKEAVRLADQKDRTTASVAKELGLHPNQIYNWRRQFNLLTNKQFTVHDGIDYSIKENSEMRKMRKELNDLKKENEFLKKAAAYFAKNQE